MGGVDRGTGELTVNESKGETTMTRPDLDRLRRAHRSPIITTDGGRGGVTKLPSQIGAFKTPSLRNVAVTGPYFHDGSVATLEEVVDLYDRGTDFDHPELMKLFLSTEDKTDLVEFVKACSGPLPEVETGRLPE